MPDASVKWCPNPPRFRSMPSQEVSFRSTRVGTSLNPINFCYALTHWALEQLGATLWTVSAAKRSC